jgi:2-polyprenyl-3-methyl-5-hydroxy-6-metoxy-1,4-benzoquinol methylase
MTQNKFTPDADLSANSPSDQALDAGYWESRLRQNWGLHGVGHISYGVPYNRWLYRVRRNIFRREMDRLRADWKSSDVLDVGSGTGFWIDAWKALGVHSITGSDVTQVAVDHLQLAHPDSRFTRLDISGSLDAQHPGGPYDVISAFDVLFHITNDARFASAITNISRVLSPGGYFIFSDNFLHGSGMRADHQVSRSLQEISQVVTNAGFQIIRRVPMFILMNAPVDTSTSWPFNFWRLAMLPVRALPPLGSIYGALLYPLELQLTRFLRESPTTEMMICQKKHDRLVPF